MRKRYKAEARAATNSRKALSSSCGYTCLLSKVTLWVIALGWDRSGFPVRFSPPVTLQIITQGQLLTWQYLAGNLIHGDRMEIANRETNGLLVVVLLLLIRQYAVDLAIQNFVLRRMRRRRLRLRFLQFLQLLYLFYRTRRLRVARRRRCAWVFPRPQNWFQELLITRALDPWWKENFRAAPQKCAAVSRITFFLHPIG